MPTVNKNLIIFDEKDWLGGLHPHSGEGLEEGLNLFKNGFENSSGVNPFETLGCITASKLPSDVVNSSEIDGVIKNIVPNTTLGLASIELWAVGGTKVYKLNDLTGEVKDDAQYPHAVASSEMEDVVIYRISGDERVLYSYNLAGEGDIGLHNFSATWTDSYWKTTLSAAALNENNPHPMIVGDDDILYIGDGNIVKSIDGSGPTANENALTLPQGFFIRSFAKINNRTLVIFADQNTGNTKGEARAFFWDYANIDYYKSYKLQGTTVGGAKEYNGSVCVVTKGSSLDLEENDRDIHLLFFNGSRFTNLGTIEAGEVPSIGGIEVGDGYLLFNSGGTIYSYGTPFYGIDAPLSPNIRLGGGSSGAIIRSFKNRLLCSSGSTEGSQLEAVTSAGYNSSEFYTTHAEPINGLASKSRITKVRVEFMNTVSPASAIQLDLNLYNENFEEIKLYDDLDTVTSSDKTRILYPSSFVSTGFRNFQALQLYGNWSGGTGQTSALAIRRVIVEYENTGL